VCEREAEPGARKRSFADVSKADGADGESEGNEDDEDEDEGGSQYDSADSFVDDSELRVEKAKHSDEVQFAMTGGSGAHRNGPSPLKPSHPKTAKPKQPRKKAKLDVSGQDYAFSPEIEALLVDMEREGKGAGAGAGAAGAGTGGGTGQEASKRVRIPKSLFGTFGELSKLCQDFSQPRLSRLLDRIEAVLPFSRVAIRGRIKSESANHLHLEEEKAHAALRERLEGAKEVLKRKIAEDMAEFAALLEAKKQGKCVATTKNEETGLGASYLLSSSSDLFFVLVAILSHTALTLLPHIFYVLLHF
jgi:hypothetical protein